MLTTLLAADGEFGECMKQAIRTLAASIALVFSASTMAAYTCSGLVVSPAIEPTTGDVLVGSIGPLIWPRLCNVHATSANGVTADACRTVYATLLLATALGKTVSISSTSASVASCAAAPQWAQMDGFSWLVLQ